MRPALALAVLFAVTAPASTQPPPPKTDEVPPRFGLPYKPKAYPQETPKEALGSVVAAADAGDYGYIVAHLLDPAFADARIATQAELLTPAVEIELARLRDAQIRNPSLVTRETRVPEVPAEFRARVARDAEKQAFQAVVAAVRAKFTDDPESLKDLRRFYRLGSFPEPGTEGAAAKVGIVDVTDRAVFFKKVGDRWFVENRQADDPAPKQPMDP